MWEKEHLGDKGIIAQLRDCRNAIAEHKPLPLLTGRGANKPQRTCAQQFFRGIPEAEWSPELNAKLLEIAQTKVAMYDAYISEMEQTPDDEAYLRRHRRSFGSRPIRVVTSGNHGVGHLERKPPDTPEHLKYEQETTRAQAQWLKMSSNAKQEFPEHSSEYIQFDAPDAVVSAIREAHPEVRFGFRTKFPENHLSLAALAADDRTAAENLARVEAACREVLGPFVYGADGATFAQSVGEQLLKRGETICCAESCTGGLATQLLTEVSGSSRWTAGGFVTYSNELKERVLGVPNELLRAHGAVSEEVARAMAEGARRLSGATWCPSVTGIAGPDGGTPDKPVGTVWFALAGASGTRTKLSHFRGDRGQVRMLSAYAALQLVREAMGAPALGRALETGHAPPPGKA